MKREVAVVNSLQVLAHGKLTSYHDNMPSCVSHPAPWTPGQAMSAESVVVFHGPAATRWISEHTNVSSR